MQILRNLIVRMVSASVRAGADRPGASAVMALSLAAALAGTALGQSEGDVVLNANESSRDIRGRQFTQAPLAEVTPLAIGENAAVMASDVPSVMGPPISGNSPMFSPAQQMGMPAVGLPMGTHIHNFNNHQNLGYEIPCPTGPGCDVTAYASYEALWMKLSNLDEQFSLSRNTRLGDYDYDFGGRYTVGRIWDCFNGVEAIYTGPFHWSRRSSVAGAGNLLSNFFPSGGYTGSEINTFNSASTHIQAQENELHSFELNRRWWSWDVLSTMIGLRGVRYDEDYAFFSSRPGVGNGIFAAQTENTLIGVQIGADMMYPVGLRTLVGARGKGGVYANFDEASRQLVNGGLLVLDSRDRAVDVAGVIEYGVFARYQIVPSIRLTAGYEFWYLPGIATVSGQAPHRVNPDSGTRVDNDDSIFLHGGGAGVQVLF